MSFRESQVCVISLERVARKTNMRMLAKDSIQMDKSVSVFLKEDHEQGEDQWSHSTWIWLISSSNFCSPSLAVLFTIAGQSYSALRDDSPNHLDQ
jgi:hypothetical protein